MHREKRGPGATQEDPPPKGGERGPATTSSVSGEVARVYNEEDCLLCDAHGLPLRPYDASANIAMMGTAAGDEHGHWRTDFEPAEPRRPNVTEPSTTLQTGNEAEGFGVARPHEEGFGLSPIRDTARVRTGSPPPGFTSSNALTALEVTDRMQEQHRARHKQRRLYARLRRLEESAKTYAEMELFLAAQQAEAERAGLPEKLHELGINPMSGTLAPGYLQLAATKFPGPPLRYERSIGAMVESVAPGKPEGHLFKEVKTLQPGKMGVWPLRQQLDGM